MISAVFLMGTKKCPHKDNFRYRHLCGDIFRPIMQPGHTNCKGYLEMKMRIPAVRYQFHFLKSLSINNVIIFLKTYLKAQMPYGFVRTK